MKITLLLFFLLFNNLQLTVSAQIQWEHTGGPEGGGFHDIWTNSSYAFCKNSAFLYRTSDNQSWEKISFFEAFPFAVSDTLLATTKNKPGDDGFKKSLLYISKDNGTTWLEGSLPISNSSYESLALCSHGIYINRHIDRNKIYRSKNYGESWDTINLPLNFVRNIKSYEDKIFIDLNNNIHEYDHHSDQFKKLSNLPAGVSIYNYAVFGNTIFMNCTDFKIYTSNDYGSTWSSFYIGANNTLLEFIKSEDKYYFKAINFYRKNNAFVPWEEIKIDSAFYIDNLGAFKNEILAVDFNRGCYKVDIPNNKLIAFNTGTISGTVKDLISFNDKIWANTPTGIFTYQDSVWQRNTLFPDRVNGYDHIVSNNSNAMAVVPATPDSIFVSSDFGQNWYKKYANFDENQSCPFIIKNVNWLGNHMIISSRYAFGCGLYSKDFGDTWELIDMVNYVSYFKNAYYAVKSDALCVTYDFGESWINKTIPGTYVLYTAATKNKLFVFTYTITSNGSDINLYTSDDGENWKYSSDGISLNEIIYTDYESAIPVIIEYNRNYFIKFRYEKAFISIDSCQTWLPYDINDVPDLIVDSKMYKADYGVHKAQIPDFQGRLASGKIYYDENKNMHKDSSEKYLSLYPVRIEDENGQILQNGYTNAEGQYSVLFYDEEQIRIIPGQLNDLLELSVPSQIIVDTVYENLDFAVQLKSDITDVSADGILNGRARPGFERDLKISLKNNGSVLAKGNLGVKLDKNFRYHNADPAPTAITGTDSLSWDIKSVGLFEHQKITIEGYIDSFAVLGSRFEVKGRFSTEKTDYNLTDNTFIIEDTIVGSFDPNEKLVYPAHGLTKEDVETGKELIYTILFQNTGNYEADRVRITDQLDTALNVQTLRIIDASHPLSKVDLLPGHLLQFVFDNIFLPDSNANEPESHGYVTFAIQRQKNFKESYVVKNTASIYFDFNHPIITNTTLSPLYKPKLINNTINIKPDKQKLQIMPVPAQNYIKIVVPDKTTGTCELFIYDSAGTLVQYSNIHNVADHIIITTEDLPSGMYFAEWKTVKKQYISPFIISR